MHAPSKLPTTNEKPPQRCTAGLTADQRIDAVGLARDLTPVLARRLRQQRKSFASNNGQAESAR